MHFKTISLRAGTAVFLLLPLLLLASCARAPWTTVIEGDRKHIVEQAFNDFNLAQKRCQTSWDGEVDISWTSAVQNYSFSAYYRTLEPSYLKSIVSNPLGQPLKIITTDGTTYQVVDTVERSAETGSLNSWAAQHDLPLSLVKGPWLDWLGGRTSAAAGMIGEIRLDSQQRGAWLSIIGADSVQIEEHILFDWESGKIVERIVLDERNQQLATLKYLAWQEIDRCLYPVNLAIGGLPLGAGVELRFSDIRQGGFGPRDFKVDYPQGFSRSWLP